MIAAPLIELLTKCPREGHILTPTRRLARFCHKVVHQSNKRSTSAAINVFVLDDWLLEQYLTVSLRDAKAPCLLDDRQCEAHLTTIIQADPTLSPLVCAHTTAKQVKSAYAMVCLWCLSPDQWQDKLHCDIVAFCRWINCFETYCQQHNFLPVYRIAQYLATQAVWQPLPTSVWLLNFDDHPPAHQTLFTTLRCQGCVVAVHSVGQPARVRRIEAKDRETEWLLAARYAKAALAENNEQTIALVIPDLAQYQVEIARQLQRVLQPDAIVNAHAQQKPVFTMSAGRALSALPVIAAALDLLRFCWQTINYDTLFALIRSPFMSAGLAEHDARVTFDYHCRQFKQVTFTHCQLLEHVRRYVDHDSIRALDGILVELHKTAIAHCGQEHYPSKWAAICAACLQAVGWPGEAVLDSEAYQAVMQWHGCLDEMVRYDGICGRISYPHFLNHLKQICDHRLFQIEADDCAIHVLGILEAAGLLFDKIWVCNLHDGHWPPAAQPNPFIPLDLQRQHQLPHASAERELDFAQRIIDRFAYSTTELILSTPMLEDDRPLTLSRLISDFPLYRHSQLVLAPEPTSYYSTVRLVRTEQHAVPIGANESTSVSTGVVKAQSACPFQAFARYRLSAAPRDIPQAEPTALERGTMVHAVLQNFWQQHKCSQVLLSLSEQTLEQHVETLSFDTINDYAAQLPSARKRLECQMLTKKVTQWLSYERSRTPFSVHAIEIAHRITIGPLSFTVRLDRVDNISGLYAIIDYKTGHSRVSDWFGPRPDAPQMIIYAQAYPSLIALAIAEVSSHRPQFRGLADDDCLPDISTCESLIPSGRLKTVLADLHDNVKTLCVAYAQGDARIDPKYGEQTCRLCNFGPLCRVADKTYE